jgi:hypothetical protein
MMKEHLGRCAEQLRKAVRHLANGLGTPQEKLTSMYNDTGFGSICEGDFPKGTLKNDFLAITGQMSYDTDPQFVVHITALSDERARRVIEQICCLSEAVAYALGRQSNSA